MRISDWSSDVCSSDLPDVEETIKWGAPSFVHAGGILAGMAAFKQHASSGYWKHALVVGEGAERDGMGSYGKLAGVSELPPRGPMLARISRALVSNEQGAQATAGRQARSQCGKPTQRRAEERGVGEGG